MDCDVRNANYERVMAVMEKLLRESDGAICSCPQCVNDIAAIALNYLPPHYYTAADNDKESGSPWMMVETAVREAIARVLEHPAHTASPQKEVASPDVHS